MEKLARQLHRFGMGVIALCLAAAFGFSANGAPSLDRLTRQQQRSRTQRSPRHRVCPSVSAGTCIVSASFARTFQLDEPVAALASTAARPIFRSIGVVICPTLAQPGQAPTTPSVLPRPPPLSA